MIDTAYRVRPLGSADPERVGDYLLVGRLGRGGMGMVYLAESDDGSYAAIKLIHPDLTTDPEFARRFRGEVERARRVPPFCTAEFLHADLDHDPPYLVVEYIDGPSLEEVIAERGPLRGGALHSLAVGVATALTGIHGAGIIHRDLKPDNVLLAPGSPKVIDFGIARPFEATSQHTRADVMVGTVAYMAPERFSGESETPVTAAADVFAWGCVIAFAGTGRTPFHGDSPSATAARILTQPPRLDGLPESLREAVGAALAKDPTARPTAPELLAILLGNQSGAPSTVDTQPSAPSAAAVRPARRGRAVLGALVALPVLVGVAIAGLVADADDTPQAGPDPSPSTGSPSPTSGVSAQAPPAPKPTVTSASTPAPTRSRRAAGDPGELFKPAASATATPKARASVNTSGRNLALGRPVTASSVEGANWAAAHAVDGDLGTRWGSQFSDPQWLTVDLGAQWRINEVVLRWDSARAFVYRLEVSVDGRRWTKVYGTILGAGEVDRIPVDGATGRYVRMYGTQRNGNYGYSLHEIEVR
ncbi:discoidin domain-containing protein [Micromonospora sp. WMMD975]|uniref:serine/threonine protein kinase n=1 Tax=Micromonospora sp. WMMD975 TaxID=3016087 RepID=UPI00249C2C2D|nr:discoidin domain-containing protein [Micromonospora sp. WMMD975]WFE34584.1 discoidin domain-containing protein [Micromonospora sp. WMMD975]